MEIVVKVISMMPEQSGTSKSGNQWRLKTFIGETQERYSKKVCFEIFGDNLINSNPVEENDIVTISFDLESQEYNGRWYTKVRVWKIVKGEVEQNNTTTPPNNEQTTHYDNNVTAEQSVSDGSEELPF